MIRKSFKSSHGTVSYIERDGPIPVIFLHGLGGTGNSWIKLSQYMDSEFGLYFLDLLGHGRSEKREMEYTVSVQEDVIEEFAREKHLEEYSLMGNSYGGWIAMRFSVDRQLPSHLVLEDSAGINRTFGETDEERRRQFVKMVVKSNSMNSEYVIDNIVRNNANPVWKMKESELRGLKVKTLIIWGKDDTVIPIEHGLRLKELIPSCVFQEIDGGGHVPHVRKPEQVAGLVNSFLKS